MYEIILRIPLEFCMFVFQLAIEAISNIRTVAGLRCEELFSLKYQAELVGTYVRTQERFRKKTRKYGI